MSLSLAFLSGSVALQRNLQLRHTTIVTWVLPPETTRRQVPTSLSPGGGSYVEKVFLGKWCAIRGWSQGAPPLLGFRELADGCFPTSGVMEQLAAAAARIQRPQKQLKTLETMKTLKKETKMNKNFFVLLHVICACVYSKHIKKREKRKDEKETKTNIT